MCAVKSDLCTLKFDDMAVDTSLADEYLRSHEYTFRSQGCYSESSTGTHALDRCNNKICYGDRKMCKISLAQSEGAYLDKCSEMLRSLATKVQEKANLFAQLEYLIRDVPVQEVKSCDIELIIQNLLYWSGQKRPNNFSIDIFMDSSAPLANLGFVAPTLMVNRSAVIEATKEVAVVCHLFVELCQLVGLSVHLVFLGECLSPATSKGFQFGCSGVVTERSDIDSAVDAFLFSSSYYPWKLQRLFVQESAYETFTKAMSWKTSLKRTVVDQKFCDSFKSRCTELFAYNEKIFLFDYAGLHSEVTSSKQLIFVEAYRTTKELLSLLKQASGFCVSLWSSDISEANEIAFCCGLPIVWINDFGYFQGPPKASQAYYSIMEKDASDTVEHCGKVDRLNKLRDVWMKKDIRKRVQRTLDVIDKLKNKEDFERVFVENLQETILNFDTDNFVEISKGRMCVGRDEGTGIVLLQNCYEHCYQPCIDLIKSIIKGTGVLINVNDNTWVEVFKLFAKEGMPVLSLDTGARFKRKGAEHAFSQTKVVWTRFGTIFAN